MRRKARANYDLPGRSLQRTTLRKTNNSIFVSTNATTPAGTVYDRNVSVGRISYHVKKPIGYAVKSASNTQTQGGRSQSDTPARP